MEPKHPIADCCTIAAMCNSPQLDVLNAVALVSNVLGQYQYYNSFM